jgi:hypothetical protein
MSGIDGSEDHPSLNHSSLFLLPLIVMEASSQSQSINRSVVHYRNDDHRSPRPGPILHTSPSLEAYHTIARSCIDRHQENKASASAGMTEPQSATWSRRVANFMHKSTSAQIADCLCLLA